MQRIFSVFVRHVPKTNTPFLCSRKAQSPPSHSTSTISTTGPRRNQHTLTSPGNMESVESQTCDTVVSWYANRSPMDWFRPPPGFDDEIRTRFGALTARARIGALDAWTETPKGSLALVILLDQFPRNMFRNSAEAFSSDHQALQVATRSIARGFDVLLGKENRQHQMLLYMPLMHAEDLLAQVTCRMMFAELVRSCQEDPEMKRFMEMGPARPRAT
ncbi:hypothetical protein B0I37DRAFT_369377 [Chaetomium sp. MPI-CAGE-AT-0009]|nr:hypothetical protein B0I37DRAFT_369377 [Chaetomium sp. MPI-CAGE-AT-0009]